MIDVKQDSWFVSDIFFLLVFILQPCVHSVAWLCDSTLGSRSRVELWRPDRIFRAYNIYRCGVSRARLLTYFVH